VEKQAIPRPETTFSNSNERVGEHYRTAPRFCDRKSANFRFSSLHPGRCECVQSDEGPPIALTKR
jgi:hypothetical protein